MNWRQISDYLLHRPYYEKIRIDKGKIPHPSISGFIRSLGELKGQVADWRKSLKDGSCLHVEEYSTHYVVHRDKVDPHKNLLGHLVKDAPHWLMVILLIISGIGLGAYYLSKGDDSNEMY
jgi:hypothetical protein